MVQTQVMQWGVQSKATRASLAWHSFILISDYETYVPSLADFEPGDWIVPIERVSYLS